MFRKVVSMGNMNFIQKGKYKGCSSYGDIQSLTDDKLKESIFQKNQSYGRFLNEDKEYKTKALKQYVIQRYYKKMCFV